MRKIFINLFLFLSINNFAQEYGFPENKYYPHLSWDKWGYVDSFGNKVIKFQFEEAYSFIDGRALVKKNGKYGFIDLSGNIVIDCKFDDAQPFKGAFAWVKKDGLESLISRDGVPFLNYWFVRVGQFHDGYARAVFRNDSLSKTPDNKYIVAYIDENGKQLSGRWFSGGGDFKNGRAKLSVSGEYFYIDTIGSIIMRNKEQCDEALPYEPNLKVQELPKFPGAEPGFKTFVENHLEYPKKAQKLNIEGKVYVKFIVNTEGKVINATVFRGVHYLLDREAVRVINSLPDWTPGKIDGKPVCVPLVLPIIFQLR